jgi:ADP-ribose pyrophosphatase YjhB (NUDIX family)
MLRFSLTIYDWRLIVNRRVRVSAAVLQGGKILLVKHTIKGATFWALPGGNSVAGEPLSETAVREVKEETGMEVKIVKLLYVADNLFKSKVNGEDMHEIDVCFIGHITGGGLKVGSEPEVSEKILFDVRFFRLSELSNIVFHPPALIKEVKDWLRSSFSGSGKYLGTYKEGLSGDYIS